ncbi:TNF receptor-associated factor homolog 1a-like [Bidens hawaiensis]|uniref:TNF receptor-associated factor homolog 1a-like n=1 Tax=Bidens hawaiensis TaxID=980011 RepID=UPI004049D9B4
MATNSSDESNDNISLEEITKGVASILPVSFETDDNNDFGMNRRLCPCCGKEPSELYGKYTWMIDKFSQISRRELRSNAFEVGGYKWSIFLYPKGCDVSDHLSVFLCVADHDTLPKDWFHFAQFTAATRYIVSGRMSTFGVGKRFWSFCKVWSSVSQDSRDQMSREKADSILPLITNLFFLEKEVTSTLLMESLCDGLTALKEPSMPVVRMEEGSFVLVVDLVLLLERVAVEPLVPMVVNHIPGDLGEVSQAVESDEKCLTEYGRKVI